MTRMTGLEPHTMKRTSLALARGLSRNVTAATAPQPRSTRSRPGRLATLLVAATVLAGPSWAGSEFASAPVGSSGAPGPALTASAHLNFRITVLPALSLRSDALGQWQAHSNNGPLVLQGAAGATEPAAAGVAGRNLTGTLRGPLAAVSAQAQPDASGRARITIASP